MSLRVNYIQFIYDVPSIGTYWSLANHGSEWLLEEKADRLVFTNSKNKQVREVLLGSAVGSISRMPVETAAKGKKAL